MSLMKFLITYQKRIENCDFHKSKLILSGINATVSYHHITKIKKKEKRRETWKFFSVSVWLMR